MNFVKKHIFTILFVYSLLGVFLGSKNSHFICADFGASAIATIIASAVVSATATGVGAGVQAKQTREAQNEARGMYNEETAWGRQQADKQMQFEKDRFAFDKTASRIQLSQNEKQSMENLLNRNMALRDAVLSRWGRR